MINIFLCDDIEKTAIFYKNTLQVLAKKYNYDVNIKYFDSGEALVEYIDKNPGESDIIYLDILMGNLNGIDTGIKLRELGCTAEIIFLTSSEQHVFDAFNVAPLDYILKEDRITAQFEKIFLKAIDHVSRKEKECYIVEINGVYTKVPLSVISFFEVNNRLVTVHFGDDESLDFYARLEDIEQELGSKGFLRIHRSYLVNCQFIQNLAQNKISLSTNKQLPVSAAKIKDVKKVFSNFLLSP